MTTMMFLLIGAIFILLLLANLFIRLRVLKLYRKLRDARVDFDPGALLSKERMETEVVPLYPEHAEELRRFNRYIKTSMRIAIVVVLMITLFGGMLMYYQ